MTILDSGKSLLSLTLRFVPGANLRVELGVIKGKLIDESTKQHTSIESQVDENRTGNDGEKSKIDLPVGQCKEGVG